MTQSRSSEPSSLRSEIGDARSLRRRSEGRIKGRLELRDVWVEFQTPDGPTSAVREIDLTIEPGEFVCLLGPSGCGKSTLLNCVAGFVKPTRGTMTVDGQRISGPSPDRGMVFQAHSLFPWKTAKENVAFGPLMAGHSDAQSEEIARTFLSLVGLLEVENRYPATLSGGMQQRVGIARALANYPSVLLMDEPFGALDAQTRLTMQESLLELWAEFHTTVLFVTHDIDEAIFLGDRVIVMSASPGRLIDDLDISFARPRTPEVYAKPEFAEAKLRCLRLIREESQRARKALGKR